MTDTTPDDAETGTEKSLDSEEPTYILNINTHKFHYPWCSSVTNMKEKNKREFFGTREEAIEEGYTPCKQCKP